MKLPTSAERQWFRQTILRWFTQHGRKHLPWQQDINPYRVWVSEIMLQQTQVNTVIPYFERFMAAFPDVSTLAHATEDSVLHHWTGLGYYSRARSLHRSAKIICESFAGQLPPTLDTLQQLPGIGRSTAGAILAIAFKNPAPILDGNVKRVLSRFAGVAGWPGDKIVEQQLWSLATCYTPTENTADYTQAMMDLGAGTCTRTHPHCTACPLQTRCYAYKHNLQTTLPGKKVTKPLPIRQDYLLVLQHAAQILLEKRPSPGIWGGLWCFPVYQQPLTSLTSWCQQQFTLQVKNSQPLPVFRHTFTHFHYDITPLLIEVSALPQVCNTNTYLWYDLKNPPHIGLAAPIKKVLLGLHQ